MKKNLFLFCLSFLLVGCTTVMSNKKYFRDYINKENTLKEVTYICELDHDRPAFGNILFDRKGLHYMFSKQKIRYDFIKEICLDEPQRLEIGNKLIIKEIIKESSVEYSSLYAFGEVFHPGKGKYVPFKTQFNIFKDSRFGSYYVPWNDMENTSQ